MTPQSLSLRYALFFATVFAAVGAHLPFWPLWLESRGLTAAEIGLAMALGSWMKLAVNPTLAHLSDRAGWGKGTIVLLTAVSLAAFLAFIPAHGFAWILAIHLVTAACFPLLIPLAESQTMAAVYRHSLDYGRIRLWGSLAFIAGTLATGRLLGAEGADWVLWIVLAALAGSFVTAATLPGQNTDTLPGAVPEDVSLRRLLRLFARREILIFLAAAALIQASHAAYYAYSSLTWKAAGIGETRIALLWTVGVVAEILFFAFSRRLPASFTPGRLLVVAGLAASIRWLVTGMSSETAVLAVVQSLHAASFAATHLAAMHHITRSTPPRLAATMQSLYAALSGGLAMGGAMLLAAACYAIDPGLAFFAMAAIALAAAGLGQVARVLRAAEVA
jgi:PPP family 3-phenylpropionic acid transporter